MMNGTQKGGFCFLLGAALTTLMGHASAVEVDQPTELTPMMVNAELTQTSVQPGGTVTVVVGIRLFPGWHTYASVPANEPYVQTKWMLEPGKGVVGTGEWIKPPSVSDSQNPQLKLYESQPDPLLFLHELRVADSASGEITVRAGLLYQTCNFSRCLPPTRKTFDLKLKVVSKSEVCSKELSQCTPCRRSLAPLRLWRFERIRRR